MTPQERIKADAEKYANNQYGVNGQHYSHSGWGSSVHDYIAGATAENDRAQVLTERLGIALENIYKIHSHLWSEFDRKEITSILERWESGKGKGVEVTDEEKYQQWIKENVTVLGEFDFLFANKRIYGKKELRRIYDYLTNPRPADK